MGMYKFFAILIVFFSLTGCIRFFPSAKYEAPVIPTMSVEPVADVVLRYATELKYEKELNLMDSRIIYDDSLRRVRLNFVSQKILELCTARTLLVDVVEGLLKRLNESADARNQTFKRHFDYYDLEICIHYESFYVRYDDPMYISWVTLCNGISSFYAGDVFSIRLDKWHARSEEYYKSRLFVTIMRDSEQQYKETHPKPYDIKPNFGKGNESPIDWFGS